MALTKQQRRVYQAEYRQRRRADAVAYLGGICDVCGTTEKLEFNHIDPTTKSFSIGAFWGTLSAYWTEVEKCNLLCVEHHLVETSRQYRDKEIVREKAPYVHGKVRTYVEIKCRCGLCREAKRLSRKTRQSMQVDKEIGL